MWGWDVALTVWGCGAGPLIGLPSPSEGEPGRRSRPAAQGRV